MHDITISEPHYLLFYSADCKYTSAIRQRLEMPHFSIVTSLRSWRDFARECFCFGSEAVNASGEAVRGLVKSPVEFLAAQIRGFFLNYAFTSAREFQIGCEYRNVNQMLIYTSHLSQGKRFVFIHRFANWRMRRKCIEEALASLNMRWERKEPLKS